MTKSKEVKTFDLKKAIVVAQTELLQDLIESYIAASLEGDETSSMIEPITSLLSDILDAKQRMSDD